MGLLTHFVNTLIWLEINSGRLMMVDPEYNTTVAGNFAVEKNVFSTSRFASFSGISKDKALLAGTCFVWIYSF